MPLALAAALLAILPASAAEPVVSPLLEPQEVIFRGQPANPAEARSKATFAIRSRAPGQAKAQMMCTATLIAGDVILTAAHCRRKGEIQEIVRYEGGKPRHIRITGFVPHPRYQSRKGRDGGDELTHDIAVAKLARPVPGAVVAKVPAASLRLEPDTEVVAMGYGMSGGSTKELAQERPLRQTRLKATLTQYTFALTPFLSLEGERNICSGDSGGPSFLASSAAPLVVGVHSLAESGPGGTCVTNRRIQADDTYVPYYSEWIEKEVKKLKAELRI